MPDPTNTKDPATSTISNTVPHPVTPPIIKTNNDDTPPVISGSHEQEPTIMAPPAETAPIPEDKSEIAESSTPEVKIPQELKEVVKKTPEDNEIKIEPKVTEAGAKPAAESTPVITTPTGTIKMPMTYTQARLKSHNTNILDSGHWLAAMIMYEWSKYEPDLVKEQKST